MIETFGAAGFLPLFQAGETWIALRDGDPDARELFRRHYSHRPYADGRDPSLFVGPGEKLVMMTPDGRALWVWRKFICADGQQGVNCAVFRNEGPQLSSDLIRSADAIADARWPGERHYTYVNPRRVASRNPGWCFMVAGWRRCGTTRWHRLRIFERPSPRVPG